MNKAKGASLPVTRVHQLSRRQVQRPTWQSQPRAVPMRTAHGGLPMVLSRGHSRSLSRGTAGSRRPAQWQCPGLAPILACQEAGQPPPARCRRILVTIDAGSPRRRTA